MAGPALCTARANTDTMAVSALHATSGGFLAQLFRTGLRSFHSPSVPCSVDGTPANVGKGRPVRPDQGNPLRRMACPPMAAGSARMAHRA